MPIKPAPETKAVYYKVSPADSKNNTKSIIGASRHAVELSPDAIDNDTQTSAVSVVDVSVAAAPMTREVGSMATFSPSGAQLVSVASQAVVRMARVASQANVAVSVEWWTLQWV